MQFLPLRVGAGAAVYVVWRAVGRRTGAVRSPAARAATVHGAAHAAQLARRVCQVRLRPR